MSRRARIDPSDLNDAVEAEVQKLAGRGVDPNAVDEDLHHAFAQLAPAGAEIDSDFDTLLDKLEDLTFIEVAAPTDSLRRGVPHVKRLVRKAIAFNLRYIAQQVSTLGRAQQRALRILNDRLTQLERTTPELDPVYSELALTSPYELEPWHGFVIDQMADAPGRVLIAGCRHGRLVRVLTDEKIDAYGVAAGMVPDSGGIELRAEPVPDHLGRLPDRSLGGLVLTSEVDRLSLAVQLQVATEGARVLAPSGKVVVLVMRPPAWEDGRTPVERDLAEGRPLHPETWVHLLGRRGFDGQTVVDRERAVDHFAIIATRR